MKIVIHSQHLDVPPDLRRFLEKHVIRPLARVFDDSAAELDVHLNDARSRKGGVDQECRMSFRMPGARTIHVEATEDDLYKAVLGAGDRIRRHVRKQLSRMRSPARKAMHRPLGRTWRERSSRRGVTPDGAPAAL
jgi:ribosomal subunit interface protein